MAIAFATPSRAGFAAVIVALLIVAAARAQDAPQPSPGQLTATPSARSRAICLRPTDGSLVELTTPLAATTRNQGSRLDSFFVSVASRKATWRAVTCRCRAMVP